MTKFYLVVHLFCFFQLHAQTIPTLDEIHFPGASTIGIDSGSLGNLVLGDDYALLLDGASRGHLYRCSGQNSSWKFEATFKFWETDKGKVRQWAVNSFSVWNNLFLAFDPGYLYYWKMGETHPRKCRLPIQQRYCHAFDGPAACIPIQNKSDTGTFVLPIFPKMPSSKLQWNDRQKRHLVQKGHRFQVFSIHSNDKGIFVKGLPAAGNFQKDEGFEEFAYAYRSPSVAFAESAVWLASPSSHWIWKYDDGAHLVDSIHARGVEMPDSFIHWGRIHTAREFNECNALSGRYGKLFMAANGKYLVRIYRCPRQDLNASKKVRLQIIDSGTHQIKESELAENFWSSYLYKDVLVSKPIFNGKEWVSSTYRVPFGE